MAIIPGTPSGALAGVSALPFQTFTQAIENARSFQQSGQQSGIQTVNALLLNRDDQQDWLPFRLVPSSWREREDARWKDADDQNVARPPLVWEGGGARTISFTLLLDHQQPLMVQRRARGGIGTVGEAVDFLRSAVRPQNLALVRSTEVKVIERDAEVIDIDLSSRFFTADPDPGFFELFDDAVLRFQGDEPNEDYMSEIRQWQGQHFGVEIPAWREVIATGGEVDRRFTPKRLFLIRRDRPLFHGVITSLRFTEQMFLQHRLARVSVDVAMSELVESVADAEAIGLSQPDVQQVEEERDRLMEAYNEGRRAALGIFGLKA